MAALEVKEDSRDEVRGEVRESGEVSLAVTSSGIAEGTVDRYHIEGTKNVEYREALL